MKYHGKRDFLNRPGYHTNASISVVVEDTSARDWSDEKLAATNKYDIMPKYEFSISNCDRTLSWEIDFEDDGWMENSLHKIDVMIGALQQFRAGVELEQKRYRKRMKKWQKLRERAAKEKEEK